MALSFCANSWELLQHLTPAEMISFQQAQAPEQQQLLAAGRGDYFYSFDNSNGFEFSDAFIDDHYPLLLQHPDDQEFFYADSYANPLTYFSSPADNFVSLSPEIFPFEEFDSYQYPKRQKLSFPNYYDSTFAPNTFSGYVPNPPAAAPEFLPDIPAPPIPEFQVPAATFSCGRTESVKKPSGASLSVQSVAARERRRRITEKTQELGKLIPGGHRMNTAEMFQAASKYVKFLQAQVKVLQRMESLQEGEETFHTQDLEALLASPTIQEKLYSEEKCLAPKALVQTLANDPEIQSKPMLLEGIDQLLETNNS